MAIDGGLDTAADVAIGVTEIGGNPNLTFVYFIAFVLIGALGVRFCVYAFWNRQASDLPSQASIWTVLALVGGAAAIYGIVGVLEIVVDGIPSVRTGVFLGFVLLLALTMRSIAREGSLDDDDGGWRSSRAVLSVFALAVAGVFVGEVLGLERRPIVVLAGVGAIVFATYGYWHGRSQLSRSMVQGTMLDTLLRHLLPVLAFGAAVPAVELGVLGGIDRTIVLHVQVVFVIMTATALMTANIKLRQNLARL
ncbi:hypothetical protein [Halorhabdus amylolytica]|uniref:hypothetical protein n=1 Tax=Halorhabdus amylolytica TaxID=2559573 RepID=UPI0010AB4A2B|nr:hypothetical protein [Halorhabdus amylolytica]